MGRHWSFSEEELRKEHSLPHYSMQAVAVLSGWLTLCVTLCSSQPQKAQPQSDLCHNSSHCFSFSWAATNNDQSPLNLFHLQSLSVPEILCGLMCKISIHKISTQIKPLLLVKHRERNIFKCILIQRYTNLLFPHWEWWQKNMKSLCFSVTKPLCFIKRREFVNNLKNTTTHGIQSWIWAEVLESRQDSLTTGCEDKHGADCTNRMFRTKTAVKLGDAAQAIAGKKHLDFSGLNRSVALPIQKPFPVAKICMASIFSYWTPHCCNPQCKNLCSRTPWKYSHFDQRRSATLMTQ